MGRVTRLFRIAPAYVLLLPGMLWLAVFFVVEPDRTRLADLAQRLRDGRIKPLVGAVRPLSETPAAFAPGRRTHGKTIIQIAQEAAGER